jgi:large subunit ribosomal protein L25
MAQAIVLDATQRTIVGKQVRQLRRQGLVPGVLFGPEFDPINVQMDWTMLRLALRAAGGSSILDLKVDGTSYPVLVRHVHRAPITGDVLHVDFYRVRMDVKIRNYVPLVMTEFARELEEAGGMVMTEMNTVEVECFPADLPSHIEVSVAHLRQQGDAVLVKDLPVLKGVTYLADPEATVFTASTAVTVEAEEEVEVASTEPELIRREREDEEEE